MRDETFDVVKGLAIILMVLGHAGCDSSVRAWIYLFHMPVFFIVAGWFYRCPDDGRGVGRSVVRRFARLWWPYCFWATALILLHNCLLEIGVYTTGHYQETAYARQGLFAVWSAGEVFRRCLTVPTLSGGATGLAASYWFLPALLGSTVLYLLCDFALRRFGRRRMVTLTVVAVTLALLGRYGHFKLLQVLDDRFCCLRPTLTAFLFVHVGALLRRHDLRLGRLRKGAVWLIGIVCLATTVVLSFMGRVELVDNDYPRLTFLFVSSVAGWYFLQSVAVLGGSLLRPLAYVGRHSLSLLLLNSPTFCLVSALAIALRGDDWILLARPVVAYEGGLWWLAYLVAGVLVPLMLNEFWWRLWRCVSGIRSRG